MAIIGTFHLPSGISTGDYDNIIEMIAKSGVYDSANKKILIKNSTDDSATTLFEISLAELPKMLSGDGTSTGTTVAVSEDGKIKVDIKDDVLTDADKAVAEGLATLDANGDLVQSAKNYVGGTTTISEKFTSVDTSITALQNTLAGLTGAYVYIGAIDDTDPTADELNAKATELLGDKPLVVGHVIVDGNGIEWWYDGSDWVNLGQTIINTATNASVGVVKGDGTKVSIETDGTIVVNEAANALKLGGVDAADYVTETELGEAFAEKANVVYELIAAPADSDEDKLAAITTPKDGDIAIIATTTDGTTAGTIVSYTSYIYYTNEWHIMCGKLSAEDIVFADDIVLAGDYTQVGNITKGKTETKTLSYKGKTLGAFIGEIFTKTLQPSVTNPSIKNLAISPAGSKVEAGTKVDSISWSGITFEDGSYTYGPEPTGSTASGYTITRSVTGNDVSALNKTVGSAASGTDDNDGNGFTIGDKDGDCKTLTYKATATYTAGDVAKDNRGNPSSPEKKITAGTTSQITASTTYTSIRKVFYGTTTENVGELTSDYIRGLSSAESTGNGQAISLKVTDGTTKRMIFAYPATCRDVSSVKYVENSNSEVKGTFTKNTIKVAGVDGYNPIDYKVYVYEAAGGITARTYNVTI